MTKNERNKDKLFFSLASCLLILKLLQKHHAIQKGI